MSISELEARTIAAQLDTADSTLSGTYEATFMPNVNGYTLTHNFTFKEWLSAAPNFISDSTIEYLKDKYPEHLI